MMGEDAPAREMQEGCGLPSLRGLDDPNRHDWKNRVGRFEFLRADDVGNFCRVPSTPLPRPLRARRRPYLVTNLWPPLLPENAADHQTDGPHRRLARGLLSSAVVRMSLSWGGLLHEPPTPTWWESTYPHRSAIQCGNSGRRGDFAPK
jgi:hypothetical protein